MKCSVLIANRNDIVMLGVTIRSALEELSAIPGAGEVIVVDNSDEKYREAVKSMIPARYLDNEVKYFYQDFPCLFTAREEAARQAKGEYIFCVDSHCIFGHDSIKNAVEFMDRQGIISVRADGGNVINENINKKMGFGSIPVNWLCQHTEASKHDMKFVHGTWGALYDEERRISWKGMPWICRRDWFLNELGGYGALSGHKLAWGGGDMYLGLKTWLLGYENWAIPSRPVIHIGPLPKVARPFHRYRLYKESGEEFATFGWLVAFYALGVHDSYFDRSEIESFLSNRINEKFKAHLPKAKELAEPDRKWIAQRSKRTFYDLLDNPPWKESEKVTDYIDFEPYLKMYKARFNIAKALRPEDWYLFQKLVREYDIKSVLEFGCGLSTLLWIALDLNGMTYETDFEFMKKVLKLLAETPSREFLFFKNDSGKYTVGGFGSICFENWDNTQDSFYDSVGAVNIESEIIDLAFVDGIDPRDKQIELAREAARIIIVHDGYTRPTPGFINDMLSNWKEIKVNSVRSRLFIKGD